MTLTIALDIGGTFTDLVAFDSDSGVIHQAKSSTTPADLVVGIRETLGKSGLSLAEAESFVHGSTTAINTAIERSGARVALVTTTGMRDVYEIGRDNREEAYNIYFNPAKPYVPRRLIFEVDERLGARGEVVREFDQQQALAVAEHIAAAGVEAVAVCFLHSYVNPEHEQAMAAVLRSRLPEVYLTLSHEVLREYREYERTSTTVMNSYIGPRVSKYLGDLASSLDDLGFGGRLLIMQSNGGAMSPDQAERLPVAMMESGPVGGVIAAAEVGTALGYPNVVAFDMGGTTAKCSAVHGGVPSIAQGYFIGGSASGHPVLLPVVDIVEVGTGGGSIAWIDGVGALRVGPRSAGGVPGPIAYGWGGTEPTITDADALLGRINPARFLGGEMPLDLDAAREGLRKEVAGQLGLSELTAAAGVLRIAENAMSLAVRQVSLERGFDPRDFAMVAMGGAGPTHAAAVARELHISTIIVPRLPAHFSALGMLLADLRHDYVRTVFSPLDQLDFAEVTGVFDELTAQGGDVLADEGAAAGSVSFQRYLDVRYRGQEFTLQVAVSAATIATADREAIRRAFNEAHEIRRGQSASDQPVEVVNVRVVAIARRGRPSFPAVSAAGRAQPVGERQVYFDDPTQPLATAIYDRDRLPAGAVAAGPAIIEEYATTTVVPPGASAAVAESGEVIITIAP
jgi:N-methylhydantoinase A